MNGWGLKKNKFKINFHFVHSKKYCLFWLPDLCLFWFVLLSSGFSEDFLIFQVRTWISNAICRGLSCAELFEVRDGDLFCLYL